MILTANQLTMITDDHCSSPVAAINVTTTTTTDHLIDCPLILSCAARSNTTLVTLPVKCSKNISLMYQLP